MVADRSRIARTATHRAHFAEIVYEYGFHPLTVSSLAMMGTWCGSLMLWDMQPVPPCLGDQRELGMVK